jgi:hypothetical protein
MGSKALRNVTTNYESEQTKTLQKNNLLRERERKKECVNVYIHDEGVRVLRGDGLLRQLVQEYEATTSPIVYAEPCPDL